MESHGKNRPTSSSSTRISTPGSRRNPVLGGRINTLLGKLSTKRRRSPAQSPSRRRGKSSSSGSITTAAASSSAAGSYSYVESPESYQEVGMSLPPDGAPSRLALRVDSAPPPPHHHHNRRRRHVHHDDRRDGYRRDADPRSSDETPSAAASTAGAAWSPLSTPSSPSPSPFRPLDLGLHGESQQQQQPLSEPVQHHTPCIPAAFGASQLVMGGGVAIFHLATARVVVCRHSRHGYWFLPKGRRDVGEEMRQGAEREGFEESGYRNRLLPLPFRHSQPKPHNPSSSSGRISPFTTEPVLTELIRMSARHHYVLYWFIAETLPPDAEREFATDGATVASHAATDAPYEPPPPHPGGMTLRERIALDRRERTQYEAVLREGGGAAPPLAPPLPAKVGQWYEPVHHANTGVDDDERLYESHLLPIAEAVARLSPSPPRPPRRTGGGGEQSVAAGLDWTGMAWVVRKGWEAICQRDRLEQEALAIAGNASPEVIERLLNPPRPPPPRRQPPPQPAPTPPPASARTRPRKTIREARKKDRHVVRSKLTVRQGDDGMV